MKRLYFFVVFSFLICGSALAQVFGNEWIVFSQKYLKIKIVQDGLYRIDSAALSNALNTVGASLNTIDAHNFQVFHNGQEEYIWVEGESDGTINANDFIEFYGKKNDGIMDSSLYVGGSAKQLNPYYSLYNDTAIYFLTWNSSLNNHRLTNPNDTAFSAYTPAPYFSDHEIFGGSSTFFSGVQNSLGISDPDFIPSEGIYDIGFNYGGTRTVNINTQNAYASGPNAEVKIKIGSHTNDWMVAFDNTIHIQFLSTVFDTTYDGFAVANYYFDSIPPSSLNSVATSIAASSVNLNGSASDGTTAIAFINLNYPHTFDMEGRIRFNGFLPDNLSGPKSLLRMTNIGGSGPVRVYDFFNHQRIDAVDSSNSSIWKALVANGNGTEKPFMVVAESNVTMINSFTPENGNGTFTDFSLQSADSVFAIVTSSSLMNVGIQYKNYRQSAAGGNRNVVLANVAELYDQFAWGIGEDPLAIRHFAYFMMQTYTSPPGHLLLLGKSMNGDLARNFGQYAENLVPTYGYPPCDNSLTAGLNGSGWKPAVPVGRIAARDSAEAQWYLNKVIGYENQQPAEWMKYVLHFGGGTNAPEQGLYASYLNGMKNTIEDTSFGGIVQSYFKTSSAPIQINQSDSLRQRIEDGVSIMTFFGHASGTGFDQSIDDPANYNNANRYPFLLANSCYAGDIHGTGISSSEAFTLIDQKGTIGYLASVGVGVPGFLDIYSSGLYTAIGQTRYKKSVGECIQWTIGQAQNITTSDTLILKATCYEMTLQGDPAVVINSFSKPDYVITNPDVWFDQLTNPDSVYVYAKVTNIGKAVNDSIVIRLLRTFPNGTHDTLDQFVSAPKFRDTLKYAMPVDFQRGIGLNKIKITVDYFGAVNEMLENNNTTGDIDLLIHGSAIIPVYPYDFAVIPADTVTLKACTVNPLETQKIYRFEIDTTDLFNSPFKISTTINAPGGVVNWKPPINFTDSTVYFWRVSPDSLTPSDIFLWRQFSFQYITGQVGWGQDHIFQFTNDVYQFTRLNRTARDFEFVNDIKTLSVKNGIYYTAIPWNESWYKLNGTVEAIFSCTAGFGDNGMSIADIDPITNLPRSYFDTLVGQEPLGYLDCVGANQVLSAFDFFDVDSVNQNYAANFINAIPNGHRVLIYSQNYPWYTRIPYIDSLRTAFTRIGCDTIGTSLVPDTCAYIAWGIKGGGPGTATEIVGAQKNSILTLQDTMITNWNSGYVESPIIGPAVAWGSFHWKEHATELTSYDSTDVEIWGIHADGTVSNNWIVKFPKDSTDVIDLFNYVDPAAYPYIKLVCRMRDDTNHTPPQIDRWHVLYTPYPDAAVNPPLAFSFTDTLQEGQQAKLIVGIQNLTPWPFNDSLLLTYWLVDNNRNKILLPQKIKAPSFNGYAWFADTLLVNTIGHPGENEIWMEVNPIGDTNTQLEQYHFNNVLMVPLHVGTDRTNPLLDVTFDGVHIMDQDIVSGKPNILISLKDENQFLALNDTADFNIFLKTPSQSIAQRIYFGTACNELCFTPAVLPHNSCKILFTPICSEDGTYELIVQAKDRSNNQSGLIDYRITFDVINAPSVTDVLNYPNPFSTSTQFVFTLTGNEVPQLFTIQIMTVTGKVVREINRDEFGDLHIGRNVTSYAWDGKDMYGDQLANGVYLYRVITRLDGNTMDHRESGADTYIMHGFGKMYLMR
jgi:hypothetical protein